MAELDIEGFPGTKAGEAASLYPDRPNNCSPDLEPVLDWA
jgi:hypothetical protein